MKKAPLFISFLCLLYSFQAFAIKTQVNEVSDLFDKYIENKDALLLDMKKQTDNAVDQIKSGKHHDSIEGIKEAEAQANELNSIKETDLESAGRQKRISEPVLKVLRLS